MNLKKSCLIVLLTMGVFTSGKMYSQVSVGDPSPPLKGALLDIKQGPSDANNTNSTKGVLFPRVFIADKTKLGIDADTKALEYAGAQVYNTNDALGKGMYTWDGEKWMKYVTSVTTKKTQDTEMVAFRTTGKTDIYAVSKSADIELLALRVPSWTATLDGNLYISAVLYAKLAANANASNKATDLGNTFFKIILTGSDNSKETFLAACTPINAQASANGYYARNNPAVAMSQGAASVKKGVTYSIKVYATEGWAENGTITAGTYDWSPFFAYSTLKADFISVPY
ncbi:hypothetical protein SAMN04488018_10146 [Myroides marinus]|uniref:Uncharacterized protein n=1 Tax=Myroides marinus TaxID=703342 RepID=A0A1H6R066_9FLAO|nr:hypothetical protein [Myroides marinus]MDM1361223.1 hypothetical protein [Myroides marinus]MDM1368243.1 hypothetical protein [Myroides marinus]MDM1375006.1 hypothetical protein [Myroides marinus]MDM1383922.1 hypothetical protein [Myroides marinus]MDM1404569.1 hypothetical protein [Myroides marinus]